MHPAKPAVAIAVVVSSIGLLGPADQKVAGAILLLVGVCLFIQALPHPLGPQK